MSSKEINGMNGVNFLRIPRKGVKKYMKKKLIGIWLVSLLFLQILSPLIGYAQELKTVQSDVESVTETTQSSVDKETTDSSIRVQESTESKEKEVPASSEEKKEEQPISEEKKDEQQTSSAPETSDKKKPEINEQSPSNKTRAAIADNLFTSAKLYKINGDEVQPSDTLPNMSGIKLSMKFSFTNKNYQAGDTFTTQLPAQIAIAKDLSGDFSPMTSAKWSINAATKELTITFLEDNVTAEEYDLTLTTSVEKVTTIDEEYQTITFNTTPTKTVYQLEMTSSLDKGLSRTGITMNSLNPRSAQILSSFNLDRTNNENRMFRVEAYNGTSKIIYDSVHVYTTDVDFNGTFVGEKTLLTEGTDYEVVYKNSETTSAAAEITLTKPVGKKAIYIESTVSGINGTNYIDEAVSGLEYNYFYGYSYTYENNASISSSYNSKTFATIFPLAAKGKINKETGMVDWEIQYNFNEQPQTSASKLLTDLTDQGVEFVEGSLSIEKIGFNYLNGNSYDTVQQGDGSAELSVTADSSGSLEIHPVGNTNQAYLIKYSTKIVDPTERVIKNKVTDGRINKEAQVSLIPNLLSKESGTIDVFNRTMEWKITINAEKYKMKQPVVHDYFIDAVKDFTSLSVVKKISDTETEPLVENVDYKVTQFDETGSPVGASPNVNGAPDSFNGGVRIDFLGEYAQLEDTLVITIKTKLETSDQKTEIKNKATLNYGDTPGVVEYEAKGIFTDPYYTGGTKLVRTGTSDNQYIYQDWLVLVNSKGTKFDMTTMEDTLPSGVELVPGSLRFEEVTSEDMLTNIQNYLRYDYNLLPEGADAYPTKIDTSNNKVDLEFGNLKSKRVYVKYKTRMKKDWYIYQRLDNTATITYGTQAPVDYKASTYVSNSEVALQKSVLKDTEKENVANWKVQTKNISSILPVENPVITDTLNQGTTNGAYDPTSFVVTDLGTGEKISTDHYRLSITGNTFKVTFQDYKATTNIQVAYSTISEFPGLVKNNSVVDSTSYGALSSYYRQATASVNLSFTSGSGSGVVKTADVSVIKVDDSDETIYLAGATFEILKSDGTETGLKADTDASGKASFSGLPLGDYLLKETKAPNGYEINPDYKDGKAFTLTESMDPIKVKNKKTIPNSIELTKTDEKTGDPLKGAIFQLEKSDGTIVSTNHETDSAGILKVEGLSIGDYQFVETKAPANYKLDKTPVKFSITEKQGQAISLEMTNTLTTGSVILTKVDESSNKGLKGAQFKLLDSENNTIKSDLETDDSGKINVSELAPGDYQFIETKAPQDYILDATPIDFTIAKGQTEAINVVKTNKLFTNSVVLTKTDESSGEKLKGAVFQLVDNEGTVIHSSIETDGFGQLAVQDLTPGEYAFIETKAPAGYVLNNEPVKFTVKMNQEEAVSVEKTNKKMLGKISLTKVDAQTDEVLSGARFDLKTKDGKLVLEDLVTDQSGKISIDTLEPGDYQFVEKEAPTGYVLDSQPVAFTVKSAADSIDLKKTNQREEGSVLLEKIDEQTHSTLAGAEFELKTADGETVIDGMTTDDYGRLAVNGLEPGEYQLIETNAPAGYELDATPIRFSIEKNQTEALFLQKTNKQLKDAVLLNKVDKLTNERLEGAVFELRDEAGKVVTKQTTDSAGTILVENLAPGAYQFIETKAPAGYKLDSTPIEINVSENQHQLVTVTKVNEQENKKKKNATKAVKKNHTYLPKTGENHTSLLLIWSGGIIVLLAGSYMLTRKRRR